MQPRESIEKTVEVGRLAGVRQCRCAGLNVPPQLVAVQEDGHAELASGRANLGGAITFADQNGSATSCTDSWSNGMIFQRSRNRVLHGGGQAPSLGERRGRVASEERVDQRGHSLGDHNDEASSAQNQD